ncbi:hypothetical protein C922_01006 [Plasmodium inui San Antonio 1]|uniref:RRM domain-containing protein n=1 Tax=Plasmodium inui San Antonio 1 TaxID=1237626 RepID=W7A651_9APIC|nr:hypothetical protein C922_01006 [Plasmodium inui San Antonio 1]EUD68607.1 hypothetical protein C922_01006 [Plasmodium inui San Antonio 1]
MNNTNKSEMVKDNKQGSRSNTTKTLWVGDLDKIKDEVVDQNYILHCMFYEFAEDIIKVKLCKEKNSQKYSYAFIEFTNFDIAKYCFDNLNGKWIPGRIHKFKLNWAKYNVSENVKTNEKSLDVELDDKGTYSIYVGGLPKGTTKEEIETLFSRFYSSICFVKVIKNTQKNQNQNKIYCFIHFFNHDECIRALTEMNGHDFKGCKIKVRKSNGVKIGKGGEEGNTYYHKNNNYQVHMNNVKGMNMGSYNVGSYGGNYAQGGYTQGNYPQGSYSQGGYTQGNYNEANYNAHSGNGSGGNNNSNNRNSKNHPSCGSNTSKVANNQANEEENKNVAAAGVGAPVGGATGGDANKNYYMYYQNLNSELNNPYKVNYYNHLSSNVTSYPTYDTSANHVTNNLSYNSNSYGSEMNYYTGQMTQMTQLTQMAQMSSYGNDVNHTSNFPGSNGQVSNYTSEFNCITNYNLTSGKEDEENLINYRMGNANYASSLNSEHSHDGLKNMTHGKKEGNGNLKDEDMSAEDNLVNHMKKKNQRMEGNLNSMNKAYGLNFYNRPCPNNEYSNNGFNPMSFNKSNTNDETNCNGTMGTCHHNDISGANNYYYDEDAHNIKGRSNHARRGNKEKNNNRSHSNTNNSTNNGSVDNNETIDNEQSVHNNDIVDNDQSDGKDYSNDEDNK